MKITVIGAGSFGTAMSVVIARCGHDVLMWSHNPEIADSVARSGQNAAYLPNVELSSRIAVSGDLDEAAAWSDTVFMVTPSHHYRQVLTELTQRMNRPFRVISGTKGIENETLARMSEVTKSVVGEKLSAFAALSGPTFAKEVARGDPTAAVIASSDIEYAQEIQRTLSCATFRLYHSADVAGVELGGSLKNVIAIAAGVVEGLGLGSNTNAALITRGLHEMTRLGLNAGGRLETFAGLAGMGDLVLTCTGSLSRNRTVGVELGRGKKLADILDDARFVAEGVKTSRSAFALSALYQIDMPIASEMYRVLYENESPRDAIQRLMSRALKAESER